jgi:hypothetical protein
MWALDESQRDQSGPKHHPRSASTPEALRKPADSYADHYRTGDAKKHGI